MKFEKIVHMIIHHTEHTLISFKSISIELEWMRRKQIYWDQTRKPLTLFVKYVFEQLDAANPSHVEAATRVGKILGKNVSNLGECHNSAQFDGKRQLVKCIKREPINTIYYIQSLWLVHSSSRIWESIERIVTKIFHFSSCFDFSLTAFVHSLVTIMSICLRTHCSHCKPRAFDV